jgi:hypothetical protein
MTLVTADQRQIDRVHSVLDRNVVPVLDAVLSRHGHVLSDIDHAGLHSALSIVQEIVFRLEQVE